MLERTWALLRVLIGLVTAVAALGLATSAFAQTVACTQLASQLRAIERNRAYKEFDNNRQNLQAIGNQIQQFNTQFAGLGCQDQLNAGQRLSLQCRVIAQRALRARSNYESLDARVKQGEAVASQRVSVLQNIARLNCQIGSTATVTQDNGSPTSRGGFLDQLFGNINRALGGNRVFGDQFSGYGNYHTVRSVCVRKSDGYYWPISFSTLPAYLDQDAVECQQQCPNRDVALYYYDNPGQDPTQMISIDGQPYTDLPNAFAYRKAYDPSNSCKVQTDTGKISIVSVNGASRAIALLGDAQFPLPIRDPRRAARAVVAKLIEVPPPRARPDAAKLHPVESAVPLAESNGMRLVKFGDKIVRIVGPVTPYAQVAAKAP